MKRALTALLLAAAFACAATVTLVNGTRGWVLNGVFVRSADSGSDWGEDRLGDEGFIGIGAGWTLEVDPGVYDIRVEDTDGDGYIRLSVPVETAFRWKVTLEDMNDPLSTVNPVYTWGG